MTAPDLVIVPLESFDRSLGLPAYATDDSAGLDIRACLAPEEREQGLPLPPLGRVLVPTGLALVLPEGHEGQLRPRSGLAARHGLTLLNSPGTIDADYRGEIGVLMINLGAETYRIAHGERIAQLIVAPVARVRPVEASQASATARGGGGFGSTGRD